MRPRALIAIATVVPLVLGTGVADAAKAKPKPKPIKKTYTVNLPVPFPAPPTGPACSMAPSPSSEHRETFKAPAPGALAVTVTGFVGDYDIGLFGPGDAVLASGGGVDSPSANTGSEKETLKYKIRKAGTFYLDVCNFLGGPTGTVTYVFTYA